MWNKTANHPRSVLKKNYFSIYVQLNDQSFYTGSALHEEKSRCDWERIIQQTKFDWADGNSISKMNYGTRNGN